MTSILKHIDFEPPGWGEFANGPALQLGYVSEILADAPLAYWRLGEASSNDVVADASGHGQHGTYIGSPTPGQPGALAVDSDTAISLPGLLGTYVNTPLIIDPTAALTLEVWCNLSANASGDGTLLAQQNGSGQGRSLLFTNGPTGWINSYLGGVRVGAGVRLYASTWRHVVLTYEGGTNGDYQFYMDGVAYNGGTLTGEAADGGVVLGIHELLNANFFHGLMDEAAVYDNVLSAERVLAHYNVGMGR